MALHKSKAARKAALATPKPKAHHRPPVEGYGVMLARPFVMAQALANAAVGNKRYEVIAASSRNTAGSMNPQGWISSEYAPGYAVPTGGERKVFDQAEIGEETRRNNIEAEKRARITLMLEDVFNDRRQNDPMLARHEMGDSIDEAAYSRTYQCDAGSYLQ